jgi:hypothetical protein
MLGQEWDEEPEELYQINIAKTQINKIDTAKELIRALGMNPEQLLTRDALAEGATTQKNIDNVENHQLTILSQQLKELIRQDAAV